MKKKDSNWVLPIFVSLLIIIGLILGLVFGLKKEDYRHYPKIAVATMTKEPVNFDIWLDYFLKNLKINKIYLRIENTYSLKSLITKYQNKYPGKIDAYFIDNVDNKNTYDNQQDRQNKFIDKIKSDAKSNNIDFILHVDDDELFWVNPKYKHIQDFFYTLDDNVENVHFTNIEAIYPDKAQTCFSTSKFYNCSRGGDCKSYANGKSAGNFSSHGYRLRLHGPHNFSGKTLNVSEDDALVLHFESCNFGKWWQKFKNLSNIDKKTYNNIPFDFYKKSINLIRDCKKDENSCQLEAKKYWRKNKVDPYYKSKSRGLMQIDRHLRR